MIEGTLALVSPMTPAIHWRVRNEKSTRLAWRLLGTLAALTRSEAIFQERWGRRRCPAQGRNALPQAGWRLPD